LSRRRSLANFEAGEGEESGRGVVVEMFWDEGKRVGGLRVDSRGVAVFLI